MLQIEHCDSQVVTNGYEPPFFERIPPEILLEILQFVVPPDILFDHSDGFLGDSYVQAMRCAIVLVCQTWYSAGVAFLYEHPVLDKYHEAVSFRRTITSDPHLGGLIKHIEFTICPSDINERDFQDIAGSIIRQDICCRMNRLSFSMPFNYGFSRNFFMPPSTLHSTTSITRLDLTIPLAVDAINALLKGPHAQLESLTIQLHPRAGSVAREPIPLEFPCLKFLRMIWPKGPSYSNTDVVEELTSRWNMPNLSQLSLCPISAENACSLIDLCLTHHHGLRFICLEDLHCVVKNDGIITALGSIIKSCASLEHAVIPEVIYPLLSDFHHPTLARLDLYSPPKYLGVTPYSRISISDLDVPALHQACPNLQYIRSISYDRPNIAELALATRAPLSASGPALETMRIWQWEDDSLNALWTIGWD
ncbi:hypothetical protein HGRIS_008398 [Hohenbuehelia grisea]|uniref:F-box domain-containing protein n=1 Tax=Hohenbuehelia grisea TaxID=104357 RepID=A0ABR3J7U1_9AGAR